jgi:aminoglycoside 2''-phosphotransferase
MLDKSLDEDEQRFKIDLIQKFSKEFPEIKFENCVLVNKGEDHAVLVLDNKRIVRFPRNAEYVKTFQQEIRLLKELINKGAKVPDYDLISRNRDFGSYEFLEGSELRVELFNSFPKEIQKEILKSIASILSQIHSLSTSFIEKGGEATCDTEGIWKYRERYIKERRHVIIPYVDPSFLQQLDLFFQGLSELKYTNRKVLHRDLTDDHILVSNDGRFVGVIDFGDADIGDPAFDFTFFNRYGDTALEEIYDMYLIKDDPEVLDRAKWHYARFLADLIFFACEESNKKDIDNYVQQLANTLPKLKKFNT